MVMFESSGMSGGLCEGDVNESKTRIPSDDVMSKQHLEESSQQDRTTGKLPQAESEMQDEVRKDGLPLRCSPVQVQCNVAPGDEIVDNDLVVSDKRSKGKERKRRKREIENCELLSEVPINEPSIESCKRKRKKKNIITDEELKEEGIDCSGVGCSSIGTQSIGWDIGAQNQTAVSEGMADTSCMMLNGRALDMSVQSTSVVLLELGNTTKSSALDSDVVDSEAGHERLSLRSEMQGNAQIDDLPLRSSPVQAHDNFAPGDKIVDHDVVTDVRSEGKKRENRQSNTQKLDSVPEVRINEPNLESCKKKRKKKNTLAIITEQEPKEEGMDCKIVGGSTIGTPSMCCDISAQNQTALSKNIDDTLGLLSTARIQDMSVQSFSAVHVAHENTMKSSALEYHVVDSETGQEKLSLICEMQGDVQKYDLSLRNSPIQAHDNFATGDKLVDHDVVSVENSKGKKHERRKSKIQKLDLVPEEPFNEQNLESCKKKRKKKNALAIITKQEPKKEGIEHKEMGGSTVGTPSICWDMGAQNQTAVSKGMDDTLCIMTTGRAQDMSVQSISAVFMEQKNATKSSALDSDIVDSEMGQEKLLLRSGIQDSVQKDDLLSRISPIQGHDNFATEDKIVDHDQVSDENSKGKKHERRKSRIQKLDFVPEVTVNEPNLESCKKKRKKKKTLAIITEQEPKEEGMERKEVGGSTVGTASICWDVGAQNQTAISKGMDDTLCIMSTGRAQDMSVQSTSVVFVEHENTTKSSALDSDIVDSETGLEKLSLRSEMQDDIQKDDVRLRNFPVQAHDDFIPGDKIVDHDLMVSDVHIQNLESVSEVPVNEPNLESCKKNKRKKKRKKSTLANITEQECKEEGISCTEAEGSSIGTTSICREIGAEDQTAVLEGMTDLHNMSTRRAQDMSPVQAGENFAPGHNTVDHDIVSDKHTKGKKQRRNQNSQNLESLTELPVNEPKSESCKKKSKKKNTVANITEEELKKEGMDCTEVGGSSIGTPNLCGDIDAQNQTAASKGMADALCSMSTLRAQDVPVQSTPVVLLEHEDTMKSIVLDSDIVDSETGHEKSSHLSPEKTRNWLPGRKLLILDINGLLADIVMPPVPSGYKQDIMVSGKAAFRRPFCEDFLQFCFENFDVGVWSSRMKKNVATVLDFLMGKTKKKLLFCWDQSHCTHTRFRSIEKTAKPLVMKELRKLWQQQSSFSWKTGGKYDHSNTLLLDDSPCKALWNPAYTAIFPVSYEYTDINDCSLGPGGDLRVYLEGLVSADNVPDYVKNNRFGQRPITETNLSWKFYKKVLDAHHRN